MLCISHYLQYQTINPLLPSKLLSKTLTGYIQIHPIIQNMQQQTITIDDVENLTAPVDGYLCSLADNTYGLQFNHFKIRDLNTNYVLFEIKKEESDQYEANKELRTIKYHFGPLFFQLQTLGANLGFKVGNTPIKDLVMIERHYFKNELIKSFRFQIPFCIPNTQNSIEAIYDIPKFSKQKQQEMIDSPWETVADSFYFVDGKLVIHTKALFSYAPFSDDQ